MLPLDFLVWRIDLLVFVGMQSVYIKRAYSEAICFLPEPTWQFFYAGHYCTRGVASPVPCNAGTYNNVTRATDEDFCRPCLGGYYCPDQGMSYPLEECAAGYAFDILWQDVEYIIKSLQDF